MTSLFDKTEELDDIGEILSRLETNCPHPSSNSKKLWKLRRATKIGADNQSKEIMLERSVAMLAEKRHMCDWFNQCPTASGVVGSNEDKHSCIDLVHWREATGCARFIELKWDSDTPSIAIRQILRYGAAYVYCRMNRNQLPIEQCPVMDAREVRLQVAAPAHYFTDHSLCDDLSRAREKLARFDIGSRVEGLSMSLDVLMFPKRFANLPFANGQEVRAECHTDVLSDMGQRIRDAFDKLTSVVPEEYGRQK